MVALPTTARLQHLEAAAQLLCRDAPTTSAALEAEHNRMSRELGLERAANREEKVCNACGNILLPGRTCNVRLRRTGRFEHGQSRVKKHKKVRKCKLAERQSAAIEKLLVYTCGRCSRETRIDISEPTKVKPSVAQRKTIAPATTDSIPHFQDPKLVMTIEQPTPVDTKTAGNAASRSRAKARKHGSLQAMLAKSKLDSSAATLGTTFGLMDFMKLG